jgi:hypothetical protein
MTVTQIPGTTWRPTGYQVSHITTYTAIVAHAHSRCKTHRNTALGLWHVWSVPSTKTACSKRLDLVEVALALATAVPDQRQNTHDVLPCNELEKRWRSTQRDRDRRQQREVCVHLRVRKGVRCVCRTHVRTVRVFTMRLFSNH